MQIHSDILGADPQLYNARAMLKKLMLTLNEAVLGARV
jgi:hypothetical protein